MMTFVPGPGWGHMGPGWHHMYGDGYGWVWLWGPLMMIFWIALLGVVVWLVARALNTRRPTVSAPGGVERAREILAERYARGEISTEEYSERLDRLTAAGTPGGSAT